MNIHTHYSGSTGNLYQVDDLLIEAGVSIQKIKEALQFRLSDICGCLISHEHGDHSKATHDLMKAGIDIYTSEGTAHSLGLKGHRVHILKAGRQTNINQWRIMPFESRHDAEEPLGFLIGKGRERLLFLTDSNYVPNRFIGLTHIMLGVDYDRDILRENVLKSGIDPERAKRTLKNHMSLQTAMGFFRANDLSRVEEIHLLHLSNDNSDACRFKEEIERLTGRPVYIA